MLVEPGKNTHMREATRRAAGEDEGDLGALRGRWILSHCREGSKREKCGADAAQVKTATGTRVHRES
jgi:hypothetical protein